MPDDFLLMRFLQSLKGTEGEVADTLYPVSTSWTN